MANLLDAKSLINKSNLAKNKNITGALKKVGIKIPGGGKKDVPKVKEEKKENKVKKNKETNVSSCDAVKNMVKNKVSTCAATKLNTLTVPCGIAAKEVEAAKAIVNSPVMATVAPDTHLLAKDASKKDDGGDTLFGGALSSLGLPRDVGNIITKVAKSALCPSNKQIGKGGGKGGIGKGGIGGGSGGGMGLAGMAAVAGVAGIGLVASGGLSITGSISGLPNLSFSNPLKAIKDFIKFVPKIPKLPKLDLKVFKEIGDKVKAFFKAIGELKVFISSLPSISLPDFHLPDLDLPSFSFTTPKWVKKIHKYVIDFLEAVVEAVNTLQLLRVSMEFDAKKLKQILVVVETLKETVVVVKELIESIPVIDPEIKVKINIELDNILEYLNNIKIKINKLLELQLPDIDLYKEIFELFSYINLSIINIKDFLLPVPKFEFPDLTFPDLKLDLFGLPDITFDFHLPKPFFSMPKFDFLKIDLKMPDFDIPFMHFDSYKGIPVDDIDPLTETICKFVPNYIKSLNILSGIIYTEDLTVEKMEKAYEYIKNYKDTVKLMKKRMNVIENFEGDLKPSAPKPNLDLIKDEMYKYNYCLAVLEENAKEMNSIYGKYHLFTDEDRDLIDDAYYAIEKVHDEMGKFKDYLNSIEKDDEHYEFKKADGLPLLNHDDLGSEKEETWGTNCEPFKWPSLKLPDFELPSLPDGVFDGLIDTVKELFKPLISLYHGVLALFNIISKIKIKIKIKIPKPVLKTINKLVKQITKDFKDFKKVVDSFTDFIKHPFKSIKKMGAKLLGDFAKKSLGCDDNKSSTKQMADMASKKADEGDVTAAKSLIKANKCSTDIGELSTAMKGKEEVVKEAWGKDNNVKSLTVGKDLLKSKDKSGAVSMVSSLAPVDSVAKNKNIADLATKANVTKTETSVTTTTEIVTPIEEVDEEGNKKKKLTDSEKVAMARETNKRLEEYNKEMKERDKTLPERRRKLIEESKKRRERNRKRLQEYIKRSRERKKRLQEEGRTAELLNQPEEYTDSPLDDYLREAHKRDEDEESYEGAYSNDCF